MTAVAAKDASFARRAAVVNTYENFYGGCNDTTKIAENDAKLLVYFDPSQRKVRIQQIDTVTFLRLSGVFGSIQTHHV
jgi:hypothetical protein